MPGGITIKESEDIYMNEVQILEASKKGPNSRGRIAGFNTGPVQVERLRVAAYCRVSTDGDEQLGSFESQKLYYDEKISSNPDWVNVGIYADEAITGTKVDKREGFKSMIDACMRNEIDLVLTKSISRFSRNTLDALQYVRMLRDKNIGIFFEKENIDTLDMSSEMILTLMSSIAQNEVESLSKNVKMGLKMKMKRGELIGFNGCFGYDYHTEDKSITVNEKEAEVVRLMYDMYIQGYGTSTIAKRLMDMGIKNRKGEVRWTTHGVMGIIRNEKYKGDILLGKTFTVDPISKRRLANMGEEDQFYLKDHHEAIVSREVWEAADAIRKERNKSVNMPVLSGSRERYTRQYALSSMCECGYCGNKLSRRTKNGGTKNSRVIWQCMRATKYGKKECPKCKAIDESIIEGAFVDAYKLLINNCDDVINIVVDALKDTTSDSGASTKKKQSENEISQLESRKSKLTDMLIDGTITKEIYEEKLVEIMRKLSVATEKKKHFEEIAKQQAGISTRLENIRKALSSGEVIDSFDREVFDSIISKVYVGGYDENGGADPFKLTFVLRGNGNCVIPDSRRKYKETRKGEAS